MLLCRTGTCSMKQVKKKTTSNLINTVIFECFAASHYKYAGQIKQVVLIYQPCFLGFIQRLEHEDTFAACVSPDGPRPNADAAVLDCFHCVVVGSLENCFPSLLVHTRALPSSQCSTSPTRTQSKTLLPCSQTHGAAEALRQFTARHKS